VPFSTLDARLSTVSAAFTLVEMLVTMALLSLIVLALMTVFNSTQNAFRASLTQTDILESGRNAMDLIAGDLAQMTPSYGNFTNGFGPSIGNEKLNAPVNFYANLNYYPSAFNYESLVQSLPGTSTLRTNVLENFFILSRQNVNGSPSWVGTGYVVDPASSPTNALYRFTMTTSVINGDPLALFLTFSNAVNGETFSRLNNPFANTTNWSHLMDGVVDLEVRPYDPNGFWMTNTVDLYNGRFITNQNTSFPLSLYLPADLRMINFSMYSNTVPASVEVELGVLEDNTLQRAESLPNVAPVYAQTAYLSNHVGQVHLFRQRVWVRNVDPTAYQ
jgi:prepilin-type N-terminal cleavage/methylation domain-containing protein